MTSPQLVTRYHHAGLDGLACAKCGDVHTTKNCQAGRTRNLPPWVNEAVDNLMMLRQRKLKEGA